MFNLNFYFLNLFIMLMLMIIMILISVAFLTLMERKLLGYIQMRKGPNKVGSLGILQPFSDAIKLLMKESFFIYKSNYLYYYFSPIISFILILMMWLIYPFSSNLIGFELGVIYLMCCLSFSVYGIMMAGWSSNSSFSMLGSIRTLSQSISYEVSLAIIMISPIILIESFDLKKFLFVQEDLMFGFLLCPLMLLFFFSILAELNRSPFDFSEGESELVSGFNVEYMSGGFILIFLSEYASIIFFSLIFSIFFLGLNFYNYLFYLSIFIIMFIVIWIRGTLPRFRYDYLMYLCWLLILPFSLNYMIYILIFKMLMFK